MRLLWDGLENLDRAVFRAQDAIDRLLRRAPLMDRTRQATKDVREPQRIITFEK